MLKFIQKNAVYIILIQVTVAVLGSLYFSDIKGYEPCVLCWYQRICMYSLFPIIIIAGLRKEVKIYQYIIPISALGWIIAFYHNMFYMGIIKVDVCSAGISCTSKYVEYLNFINIPFLSLISFSIIIILAIINRNYLRNLHKNLNK
jgi:disulfide bond formation protein DsbB